MTATCGHDREQIALLVLGLLDDREAGGVEEQIATCTTCWEEHRSMAGLPELLDRGREPTPIVPARVRDRIVVAAERRRSRRRWLGAVAAAAVVAGIVGGIAGAWLASPEPASVALAVQGEEPYEVEGAVTFATSGDELVVSVALDDVEPLAEPGVYEAWLYGADGRIVSIGQLSPSHGRIDAEVVVRGSPRDYVGFWITAEPDRRDPAHEGPTVVRTVVPHLER